MNLKLRFALLFTFFVSVILFFSCIAIYVLFCKTREDDYYRRVSKEGMEVYNIFTDIKQDDRFVAYKLIKEMHDNALFYEQVYILDSAGEPIFRFPDTIHIPPLTYPLPEIRKVKEIRSMDESNNQKVAMFMPETGSYVFVSGFDKQGFARIRFLRWILIAVFLGAVVLSVLISFFFVKQVVKPLKRLAKQMKKTTVQNLTERVEETAANDEINDIARNFNAMLERLSKSFEFQKNFVYHASHELRTPLTIMLSQTESALNKELTLSGYKQTLLSLKEEQQELIELTNSLLLISQFDQIGFVEDWPRLRIDELIHETVSSCKKMFPNLAVEISFANIPEKDDDFVIRGNESLLKSAFTNLIRNAYTYSIDQKVQITIDSTGESVVIYLDNTGTQLPADEKENIMAPFFRGANALTTKGYGLGLSIVHRFIAVHKGTVTYSPISNDINRFTVVLKKAVAGGDNN